MLPVCVASWQTSRASSHGTMTSRLQLRPHLGSRAPKTQTCKAGRVKRALRLGQPAYEPDACAKVLKLLPCEHPTEGAINACSPLGWKPAPAATLPHPGVLQLTHSGSHVLSQASGYHWMLVRCTAQLSSSCIPLQIEEDTDRDRYMSPLEAKRYGIIDHIIGGDEAGFAIKGSTHDFPKTKEEYVNWVSVSLHSCVCRLPGAVSCQRDAHYELLLGTRRCRPTMSPDTPHAAG